jgi:hypothetical protein
MLIISRFIHFLLGKNVLMLHFLPENTVFMISIGNSFGNFQTKSLEKIKPMLYNK